MTRTWRLTTHDCPTQNWICAPSSTTRFGGSSKNAVADWAFRAIRMKSRFRQTTSAAGRRRGASVPARGDRDQRLPAEEEEVCVRITPDLGSPCAARQRLQQRRDVRGLHEAVVRHDRVEAVAQVAELQPLRRRHRRDLLRRDGHQDHLLVQHLVVLEVVQQHRRRAVGVRGQEHRGARARAAAAACAMSARKRSMRQARSRCSMRGELAPPALPGGHQQCRPTAASDQREPAAVGDLDQVGAEEGQVDDQEEPGQRRHAARPASASAPRHDGEEDRGDGHRAGDRDAVRRRECWSSSGSRARAQMQPIQSAS